MTDIITDERLAEIRAVAQSTFERGRGVMAIGTDELLSLLARLDKAESGGGIREDRAPYFMTASAADMAAIEAVMLEPSGVLVPYDGWQDISTAPKDGTRVQLYSVTEGQDVGRWEPEYAPVGWMDAQGYTIWGVTHWKPLGPPPVGSGRNLADATPKSHVP